jgi:hypothetical protein
MVEVAGLGRNDDDGEGELEGWEVGRECMWEGRGKGVTLVAI